jgi:hypothetical protein
MAPPGQHSHQKKDIHLNVPCHALLVAFLLEPVTGGVSFHRRDLSSGACRSFFSLRMASMLKSLRGRFHAISTVVAMHELGVLIVFVARFTHIAHKKP